MLESWKEKIYKYIHVVRYFATETEAREFAKMANDQIGDTVVLCHSEERGWYVSIPPFPGHVLPEVVEIWPRTHSKKSHAQKIISKLQFWAHQ